MGNVKNVEAAADILVYYTGYYASSTTFPDIGSLTGFTTEIVIRDGSGELTDGTVNLSNYGQVWIIDACDGDSFTAGEISAIETFRNNGGGLLLSVDDNGLCQDRVNPITAKFNSDVNMFYGSQETEGNCFSPSFTWAGHLTKHPLYSGLSSLSSSASDACFNIQNGNIKVTVKDSDLDNSCDGNSDDDIYGAVLDECGKGRIVFDSSLLRFITAGSCNDYQYQQNIAEWLAVSSPCSFCTLTASPTSIDSGESSTLTWTTENTDSARIDNNIGDPAITSVSLPDSNINVTPASAVTYTMTVTNTAGDTGTCSATVSLYPSCTLTASPTSIDLGGSSVLTWTTKNTDSASINGVPVNGADIPNGSKNVSPALTTIYALTVEGEGVTNTCLATVSIFSPPPGIPDMGHSTGHGNYFKYDKDIVLVFTEGAKFLLKIAGGFALFILILGGVYYITSGANPDGQSKAKKTITYAIIGLAIALVSYVIIMVAESIGVQDFYGALAHGSQGFNLAR